MDINPVLLGIPLQIYFIRVSCQLTQIAPCKSRSTAFNTHRRHCLLILKWQIDFKLQAGLLLNSNIRRILQGS